MGGLERRHWIPDKQEQGPGREVPALAFTSLHTILYLHAYWMRISPPMALALDPQKPVLACSMAAVRWRPARQTDAELHASWRGTSLRFFEVIHSKAEAFPVGCD